MERMTVSLTSTLFYVVLGVCVWLLSFHLLCSEMFSCVIHCVERCDNFWEIVLHLQSALFLTERGILWRG